MKGFYLDKLNLIMLAKLFYIDKKHFPEDPKASYAKKSVYLITISVCVCATKF